MSITIPMWFIYLLAVAIVLGFINSIRMFFKTKNTLENMAERVAIILAPKVSESVTEGVSEHLSAELTTKISDEYIITKKPVKKVKKDKVENA